jgi:uncharacterized protein involved in propanediol utilization
MEYAVKIYSRIGELMQGTLSDGRAFMVSGFSSTRYYSEAWLEEDRGDGDNPLSSKAEGSDATPLPTKAEGSDATLLPTKAGISAGNPLPPKACRALTFFLEQTGADLGGLRVALRGNVPSGKGLSSSSTDVLSVLSAVNDHLQVGLSCEELYAVAARVEPTDPCLSSELCLFYQQSGLTGQTIALPPMSLLYFDADPARVIDTQRVQREWTPGEGRYFDWLLGRFLSAAERRDYASLFDCITASAEYNQTVVALPRWEEYLRLATASGAGLMVAHSGTIAGLLTPPGRANALRARLEALTGVPVGCEHYSSILL